MQTPTPPLRGFAPHPSRSALERGAALRAEPARLPYCIPICWTTADGQQLLAYPRAASDRDRYHVMRLSFGGTMAGDTLAVVDDFGNLVETHARSDLGFFHPLPLQVMA